MKSLFGIGIAVLILGVLSFFIPVPHQETHGIKAGDTKIGIETQHNERVPTAVTAVLIVAGVAMMIGGSRKS